MKPLLKKAKQTILAASLITLRLSGLIATHGCCKSLVTIQIDDY